MVSFHDNPEKYNNPAMLQSIDQEVDASPASGTGASDFVFLYVFVYFLSLLGPHPWHMEVPRLGVESELPPPAYATATATRDPSRIFDLHHSSRHCRVLTSSTH